MLVPPSLTLLFAGKVSRMSMKMDGGCDASSSTTLATPTTPNIPAIHIGDHDHARDLFLMKSISSGMNIALPDITNDCYDKYMRQQIMSTPTDDVEDDRTVINSAYSSVAELAELFPKNAVGSSFGTTTSADTSPSSNTIEECKYTSSVS